MKIIFSCRPTLKHVFMFFFLYFKCGYTCSTFLSSHGVRRRQSWNCVIVCDGFCFWHAGGEHIYRTEKASATWRGWVPPKICNVFIFECAWFFTYGWIDPLRVKKSKPNLNRGAPSDDRWRWSLTVEKAVCWPLYRNAMMTALYTFLQASSSSAPFVSPLLYIHM